MGERVTVKAQPELMDVYWTTPKTVQGRDHGNRPAAVVELRGRTVMNVTRTTKTPSRQVDQVESPVNPSCGLDKPGWWTARHQRPIPIRWYKSTEYCRYSGRLPSDEASAVARMWTVITMLGREGQ